MPGRVESCSDVCSDSEGLLPTYLEEEDKLAGVFIQPMMLFPLQRVKKGKSWENATPFRHNTSLIGLTDLHGHWRAEQPPVFCSLYLVSLKIHTRY